MGKSHIGLVYSQQINEVLDQLANLVSMAGQLLRLPSHCTCRLLGLGLVTRCTGFPTDHFLTCMFSENRVLKIGFCGVPG